MTSFFRFLAGLIVLAPTFVAQAQPMPNPAGAPYPGMLEVRVDATDLSHRIFWVHEVIPVAPGALTLLFPQWLPGTHSTAFSAPNRLAGLHLSAAGHALEWRRDPINVASFRIDVPAGASQIEAEFQFLSPLEGQGDAQRVVMSPVILALSWSNVVLYPEGYSTHQIMVRASVTLPHGWQFGSALEAAGRTAESTQFKPVTLADLVDSPLLAGKYFRRLDLDPGAAVPVWLDVVGDHAEDLEITPEQLAAHRMLVQQAYKLYGSRHYEHYDFLLSLSDQIGGIGLEHHQSSENGVGQDYFSGWEENWDERDLLPHEYTHSWNGKFRRPAGLTTTNFNAPMQGDLLWLYEGQTQYWGLVLAARSGLLSAAQVRELLARDAATLSHRSGRSWRNLQDTTVQEILFSHERNEWASWQRDADYYDEGALVWLDADTKIREMSGGKRSLDDFARAFFGVEDGQRSVLTYRFEDIVAALDAVEPYDWTAFLRTRLDAHDATPPLDGIARGGWELTYTTEASFDAKSHETPKENEPADFYYSIGARIGKDGRISDVRWDSPAFRAGLAPQAIVEAVNRFAYDPKVLRDVIAAAQSNGGTIELIVRDGETFRIETLDYRGGLRYPHLVKKDGMPDRLSQILAPR